MDAEDDEGQSSEAFKWERAYTEGLNIRSVLQEDERGSVEESIRRLVMDEKRQRRVAEDRPSKIRLGIMRYVYVAVDCSATMLAPNFYPNRLTVSLQALHKFVDKFFEINPLSQIGIIAVRDKRAERLCGFTSSVQLLKECLLTINVASCGGEFSLQSALNCALHSFQSLPPHSSKECILLISSLATVDATSIRHTFNQLKMRSVRCSIVSLAAEVYAFKQLCTTTAGKYSVALDEQHMDILLDEHVQPPPVKRREGQQDTIVRMGFPQRRRVLAPSFCACHELSGETAPPDAVAENQIAGGGALPRAFFCPQCGSRYCQTPVECRICGLLLLTAPQLARAHQHLEPLSAFAEQSLPDDSDLCCFACNEPLVRKAYFCPGCKNEFCIDCDLLLHESLQVCPACN